MRFFYVVLIVIVFGLILTGLPDDSEVAQDQLDTYCEMVQLRMQNPDLGWPDYKGIYNEVCGGK